MGLFGALFAGVSGLDSQSNKIGIISNNVANVNTVGFKQSQASFDTLVVPSATTGTFSPGGVIGSTQQLVNQQGIISATSSPTDIAISGAGFFTVSTTAAGVNAGGTQLLTREGSFTQDANGDFVNADGYFLQGLPILATGQPAAANAQNLETVSISQSATGAATATTSLSVAANLDATQTVFPGSSATASMSASNGTSTPNQNATSTQIIVGNDYPSSETATNNIVRGDTVDITSGGNAPVAFTYGGFTVGRNIDDSTSADVGDGGNVLLAPQGLTGAISTYSATTFSGGGTNAVNAAATVLTVADSSALSVGNTTITIGGATIGLTAAASSGLTTATPSINATGTLSTTLTSIVNYLNGSYNSSLTGNYNGAVFSTDGTHIFAVNTHDVALAGGASTLSNAVPSGAFGGGGAPVATAGTANLITLGANNLIPGDTITENGQTITMIENGATPAAGQVALGTTPTGTLSALATYFTTNAATLGLTGFTFTSNATNLIATNSTGTNPQTPPTATLAAGTPVNVTPVASATLSAPLSIGSFTAGPIAIGDSITVGAQVFNFVASGATGNEVNVGTSLANTLTNLTNVLNANTTLNTTDGLTFSADATNLYAQDNQGTATTVATSYTPAASIATTTTQAITGINASSVTASATGTAALAVGTLQFGTNAAINVTSGESLTQIQTALEATLPAGSSVTITGVADNYTMTVVDTGSGTSTGLTGTAITLASNPTFTVGSTFASPVASQITISGLTNIADYAVGSYVDIAGASAVGGLTAGDINGEQQIVSVNPSGSITVALAAGTATSAATGGGTISITNRTSTLFTGNILNATSATTDFLANGTDPLTASTFDPAALNLNISVGGGTPVTLSYSATPDPEDGTFNDLTTLAEAISDSSGLSATVSNGRLYVSSTNATQSVTFTNGSTTGTGALAGINWVQELDLKNIPAATTGVNQFNSLAGLAAQINAVDPTDLTATVNNPAASSTLTITEANPEQTINISDGQAGGSLLSELGIAHLIPDTTVGTGAFTTGTLGITYSPANAATDMSSGKVTPQFSHDVTVYDSQGNSHTIALNFVKLATNEWGVELTAVPASDATSATGDGQIASGTLTFNGNGVLTGDTLPTNIQIPWTNGASPSQISVNFGLGGTSTTGTADVSQSAGAFSVSQANQNGSPTGELTGVSIDSSGFVIANFSNGQTQELFQVPLASVNNPDGLESISGNAYQQTLSSGITNLQLAGTSGVGTFTPSALEQSNVDLSTQLTDLIVAQQAYGANSKLLTVADTLLQELDQIIQS